MAIPPRIGFLCVWDDDRRATWSHIPANLFEALSNHVDVADIEVEPSRALRRLRAGLNRRWQQPLWVPHPWNFVFRRRRAEQQMRALGVDVALQINDLAQIGEPYWVYRDMTWKQIADYGGDSATGVIDPRLVRLQRRHEARVYGRATGVFVFSEWAARGVGEVSSARTIVVPPGINAPVARGLKPTTGHRLLFVGRAFERKGGPQVLEATKILRSRLDVRLDIVGPPAPPRSTWPDGVAYHGSLTPQDTARLYEKASLFVMPSQFEAYGIALLESLACGVPCVARAICAIPEILQDGKWGLLVESEDPVELATTIERGLLDGALRQRVQSAQDDFRLYYTWDRAALQMLAAIIGESLLASQLNALIPPKPR